MSCTISEIDWKVNGRRGTGHILSRTGWGSQAFGKGEEAKLGRISEVFEAVFEEVPAKFFTKGVFKSCSGGLRGVLRFHVLLHAALLQKSIYKIKNYL